MPVLVAPHNKKSPLRQQCDIFIELDYLIFLTLLLHHPPRHHTISWGCCHLLIISWLRLFFITTITNCLSGTMNILVLLFVLNSLNIWLVFRKTANMFRLDESHLTWCSCSRCSIYNCFSVQLHACSSFSVSCLSKAEPNPSTAASPLLIVIVFITEKPLYSPHNYLPKVIVSWRTRVRNDCNCVRNNWAHNENCKCKQTTRTGLITLHASTRQLAVRQYLKEVRKGIK